MKKRKVDWRQIDEMMYNTFSLWRKEIVEDEPLVAQVKERWPALFSERQVKCIFVVVLLLCVCILSNGPQMMFA